MDHGGEIELRRHDAAGTEVRLLRGRLLNAVEGLQPGGSFTVKTPEAVASVRGTGYEVERFIPEAEPPFTEVAVFQDQVDTAGLDPEGNAVGARVVEAGYRTEVTMHEPPREAEPLREEERHEWAQFQREIEEHVGHPVGEGEGPDTDAAGQGQPEYGGVGRMPEPMQQRLATELGISPETLAGMSRDQVDELMRSHFGEGPGRGGEQMPMDPQAMRERFEQEYERLSTIDPEAAEMMRQEFEAFERGERSFMGGPEGEFGRGGFERFGEHPEDAEFVHEGGEFSREAFERMMFESGGQGPGPGDHYGRGPEMNHEFTREEMERWVGEHPEFERFMREMFERYREEWERYHDEFRTEFDSNFPDANRPHKILSDGSTYFFDNSEHRHTDGTVEFHADPEPSGGSSPPPPP